MADPTTRVSKTNAINAFLSAQARSGRLLDASNIKAAVVDGVSTVWESGLSLDSVQVDSVDDGGTEPAAQGVTVQAHALRDVVAESIAPSLGMENLIDRTGGNFLGGYCTTTTVNSNKLTSCFQKFKAAITTSRDYYYYNRFATAEGHQISFGFDYSPTKIDVRSRPWSGTAGAGVAALADYWPRAGVKSCDDHSITISYGSLSGEMPIQDCDEVNPSPDATQKAMVVIYDQGSVFSGRVHGTDMSFVYSTFKGMNPAYADYTYAKFCRGSYANCDGVLRKDSGW
jgi:hypothetical protein